MTSRQLLFGAFLLSMLWALVLFVALSRAELPAGMHRAGITVDTVVFRTGTYASAWLDSVRVVDSLNGKIWWNCRRGHTYYQVADSLNEKIRKK